MKPAVRQVAVLVGILTVFAALATIPSDSRAQQTFPSAVKIVSPDGLSTQILTQPNPRADVHDIALEGDVFEVRGRDGDYLEIRLPSSGASGYVLEAHTAPWAPPSEGLPLPLIIGIAAALVAAIIIGLVFFYRSKKSKDLESRAADVGISIKTAEDLFRAQEYEGAIREFEHYLRLQGGEVRNPDVYRRLAICYSKTDQTQKAVQAWEKMKALGGVRTTEDHLLGVDLMIALGKDPQAAEIYEQMLEAETEEPRIRDIHKKLFAIYRRLGESKKVTEHGVALMNLQPPDPDALTDTVQYLMTRGETELAVEAHEKDLLTTICSEFLEEKSFTPAAERIYLKCLEYNRTDVKLHKILAEKYGHEGEFRKAVSELTILSQIDKENSAEYLDEAAKLYVESGKVDDALHEGNPKIIKKIAQIYLTRSEVNPNAVATYEKVLEFQPNAVGVNKILSTVYLTRGDLSKYMSKLRLLHEIDGEHHDYLSDLAQCMIDNNLVEEALKEGNRELTARIIRQLIRRGAHDDRSVSLFEKLIKLEGENTRVRKALVSAYAARNEPAKQMVHSIALLKSQPKDADLIESTADLAVGTGQVGPVVKTQNAALIYHTALKALQAGGSGPDYDQLFVMAIKIKPDDKRLKAHLAKLRSGEAPSAVENPAKPMEAAVQAPPPQPEQPKKKAPRPEPRQEHPPQPRPESVQPPQPLGAVAAPDPEVPPQPATEASPELNEVGFPDEDFPAFEDAGLNEEDLFADVQDHNVRYPDQEDNQEYPDFADTEIRGAPSAFVPTADPYQEERARAAAKQEVALTADIEEGTLVNPVSTFVSGHESGRAPVEYNENTLFRPETGNLAYTSLGVLWNDGWSDWHRVVEINTSRKAMLRVFDKSIVPSEAHMEEFLREVYKLGFSITHTNILKPTDIVRGPEGARGFIHAHVPGNLDQYVRPGTKLPLDTALSVIGRIAAALTYAMNYKGLDGSVRRAFHLQLQPAQVIVSKDFRTVAVASLGYEQTLRNVTRAKQARFEEPGANPAYLPPEFFLRRPATVVERAVDVYSLGVMSYLLVTGEPPFEGPSFEDYKFQHAKIFPAPPRLVNPSLPEWLESMILGCLEKEAEKRLSSVSEIENTLKKAGIRL